MLIARMSWAKSNLGILPPSLPLDTSCVSQNVGIHILNFESSEIFKIPVENPSARQKFSTHALVRGPTPKANRKSCLVRTLRGDGLGVTQCAEFCPQRQRAQWICTYFHAAASPHAVHKFSENTQSVLDPNLSTSAR